ncbi:MAG: C1 family peptidase [Isosphaeraceae bacterium]
MPKKKPAKSSSGMPAKFIKPAEETPLSEFHPPHPLAAGIAADLQGLVTLLEQSGYETVEEAFGVLRVAGREMAKQFGVDLTTTNELEIALHRAASAAVSEEEERLIGAATFSLGVALNRIPYTAEVPAVPSLVLGAAAAATVSLPERVNMVGQMTPFRDQARRGTCVAHAALACYEHFLKMNDHGDLDLSEQFLYWACKEHDSSPNVEGTWLRVAFDRLYQDGVCLELTWPYNPAPIPGNEGQGPPPAGSVLGAMTYRIGRYVTLGARAVADIKQFLASGQCVAFSVPVYNTLMKNTQAMKTGKIPNPVPGEWPVGGHAMCFVGYEDESGKPGLGGGRFILKNSWDGYFGYASAYGPGYGTIPYTYIARLGMEAFALA